MSPKKRKSGVDGGPQHKSQNSQTSKRPRTKSDSKNVISTASLFKDEERAFPRGGGGALTPLEQKQIQVQADRDFLFEEAGVTKPSTAQLHDADDASEDENLQTGTPKKRRKTKSKAPVELEHEEPMSRPDSLKSKVRCP